MLVVTSFIWALLFTKISVIHSAFVNRKVRRNAVIHCLLIDIKFLIIVLYD